MKILHISDTHGCHRRMRDLPDADIIVHSGDFTMGGSEREAVDFMNWFCDLTYRHKIFISGNHDECMYGADISLELQAHLFGHIHARHGLITIGGTQFSNGAIMSANYDALNPPILLTI